MSKDRDPVQTLAEKVSAILADSANQPGIHEMNRLIKMTESARHLEQAYSDMSIPPFTTQTSHLNS